MCICCTYGDRANFLHSLLILRIFELRNCTRVFNYRYGFCAELTRGGTSLIIDADGVSIAFSMLCRVSEHVHIVTLNGFTLHIISVF